MMDRFEAVDNANADKRSIYDEGRYRAPDWVADKLNTLERELAAANAKIEKAMNELDGCDYDGQSGICDRIADILED